MEMNPCYVCGQFDSEELSIESLDGQYRAVCSNGHFGRFFVNRCDAIAWWNEAYVNKHKLQNSYSATIELSCLRHENQNLWYVVKKRVEEVNAARSEAMRLRIMLLNTQNSRDFYRSVLEKIASKAGGPVDRRCDCSVCLAKNALEIEDKIIK